MSRPSDTAQAVIDATFAEFGHAATYTPPGGSAIPCTVIVDLRDAGMRPDDGRPIAGQMTIEVRKTEIAAPEKDGVFAFDDNSVTVMNRPMLGDEEGLTWKMWAV
jgi:hypothetical protein